MELTNTSEHICPKKHKKHKKDREDKPGLKLILKVGSNNTPEHEEEYIQPLLGEDGVLGII